MSRVCTSDFNLSVSPVASRAVKAFLGGTGNKRATRNGRWYLSFGCALDVEVISPGIKTQSNSSFEIARQMNGAVPEIKHRRDHCHNLDHKPQQPWILVSRNPLFSIFVLNLDVELGFDLIIPAFLRRRSELNKDTHGKLMRPCFPFRKPRGE